MISDEFGFRRCKLDARNPSIPAAEKPHRQLSYSHPISFFPPTDSSSFELA